MTIVLFWVKTPRTIGVDGVDVRILNVHVTKSTLALSVALKGDEYPDNGAVACSSPLSMPTSGGPLVQRVNWLSSNVVMA